MDHYFLTLINGGGPLCNVQRLKVKCDEALSNCALKFNLWRYITVLVLSFNELTKLEGVGDLEKLERLDLGFNMVWTRPSPATTEILFKIFIS